MKRKLFYVCLLLFSCQDRQVEPPIEYETFLTILGIAQDAGYPQIACNKACCEKIWGHPKKSKMVSSIGIVDRKNKMKWIIDATPDFKEQCQLLKQKAGDNSAVPSGVLLTHAHIGHYTGLMHLGKEALGGDKIPVYVMPRMKLFLSTNGPWDQLVKTGNIVLKEMYHDSLIILSNEISLKPFLVPHRDEYSETVGFFIYGKNKSALFIPDIDKWQKWDRNIIDEIAKVDYAFLDGTFYSNGEIPGRDMSLIPHPFIEESMKLFGDLSSAEKANVFFIHLNHTNPLLNPQSEEYTQFLKTGFGLAKETEIFGL